MPVVFPTWHGYRRGLNSVSFLREVFIVSKNQTCCREASGSPLIVGGGEELCEARVSIDSSVSSVSSGKLLCPLRELHTACTQVAPGPLPAAAPCLSGPPTLFPGHHERHS